ncbi:MAG TPA: hypothetical protein VHU84_00190 [Lacipirellulaceae bacterium]|jgi:hypothetical protein|nr:hypothetical protein [Lacipirellulaceae bacterium]
MPFFLIPSTLGVCFFLIWAFIGGMIFRDSQMAAQRDVESDVAILPLPVQRASVKPAHRSRMKRPGRRPAQFAS